MGLLDNAKDFLDEIKDEAEEQTGIDIDRDGQTGSSPDDSQSSTSPDTSDNSDRSSSNQDSGSSGGDVSFDTGGGSSSSGGGSSSSGGGSTVDVERDESLTRDNEEVEFSQPEIPDRSNENFEQEGPERVEVSQGVTIEDQETTSRTESGNEVSRADLKQKKAEAEENRINLENQAQFLEEQGREKEAQQKRKKAQQAQEIEQQIQQNIETVNQNQQIKQRNQRQRKEARNRSKRNNTDFFTLVNPTEGNPKQTVDEELLTGGIDLMEKGQEFGRNVADSIPLSTREVGNRALDIAVENTGFIDRDDEGVQRLESAIDNSPNFRASSSQVRDIATIGPAADALSDGQIDDEDLFDIAETSSIFGTEEEVETTEDIISGTATGGTQLAGLGIAATGGSARSLRDDTPSLLEGVFSGPGVVAEDVSDNPQGFVGEEIGEEVGEKIVFGAATGGVGLAASTVPIPDFTPSGTVKGQATFSGGTRVGPQQDSTPDFVNEPSPADIDALQPEPISQEFNVTGAEVEPDTQNSVGFDTSIQNQVKGLALDNSISQPTSEAIDQSLSDLRAESVSEPESVADILSEPDVIAETQQEVRPEPTFENTFRPEPNNRPNFGLGERNQEKQLDQLFGSEEVQDQGGRFTPTLGGALFGETETVSREEAEQLDNQSFTGLGQRNVLEIEEGEEDADEKLQRQLGL